MRLRIAAERLSVLGLYLQVAVCVDFSIPSTWTHTTFNVSKDTRLKIAQDALTVLRPSISASTGTIPDFIIETSASLQWVMILQDYFTNSTANQALITNNFHAYEQTDPNFSSGTAPRYHSDAMFWGVTSYYAYRTYNATVFLDYAKMIWDIVSPYAVTPDEAASGQSSTRNVTFKSTCNSVTTAGGMFLGPDNPSDLDVPAQAVGLFVALSSYLFNATGNSTYMTYAQRTSAFIQANFLGNAIIADAYNIGTCSITPSTAPPASHSTGLIIEGWAALANITQNATLKAVLDGLIYGSVTSSQWTNTGGVNFEEPSSDLDNYYNGFKGFYIRGLHTAWLYGDRTSAIAQLIATYITIQFNALQSQVAQASQPNIYSSRWFGGPPSSLQPTSQVTALHVLNAALTLPDDFQSNTTQTSNDGHKDSGSHTNIAAIVGGAAGAVTTLALLAVLAFFLRRRRRRQGPRLIFDTEEEEMQPALQWRNGDVEPFTDPAGSAALTSGARDPYSKNRLSAASSQVAPGDSGEIAASRSQDTHHSTTYSELHSAPRVEPATVADLQRLHETVQGLMSSLAIQNPHHTIHDDQEQPPMYEPR